jgi:hypothetical protein
MILAASQAWVQLRAGDLEEIGIKVSGAVLRGEATVRERQFDTETRLDAFRQERALLVDRGRPQIRMESLDPVEFCTGRLGIVPDEKQAAVLRSTAKRGALNCARQWGKGMITAAKAVHRAWSQAGALVIFASPTERQSAELLKKAAAMVQRLGIVARGDGANAHSLLFPNGSRIVALQGTEATVRGFSKVSLMLIDEASRVTDALYLALRPMLIVGDGDLWMMLPPMASADFSMKRLRSGMTNGTGFKCRLPRTLAFGRSSWRKSGR